MNVCGDDCNVDDDVLSISGDEDTSTILNDIAGILIDTSTILTDIKGILINIPGSLIHTIGIIIDTRYPN